MEIIKYAEFNGQQKEIRTEEEARLWCPWAEVVVKVAEGWACFVSDDEYKTWKHKH